MTLAAGTYLTEKFLDEGDDEVCDNVQAKLNVSWLYFLNLKSTRTFGVEKV